MIEHDDSPTMPRPTSSDESTVQTSISPSSPLTSSPDSSPPAVQEEAEAASVPEAASPSSAPETIQVPAAQSPEAQQEAPVAPATPPVSSPPAPAAPTLTPAPAASSAPAALPAVNPFVSVDDLLVLALAGDPQVSPDGSRIAFTVLTSDGEQNTTSQAIWAISPSAGKNELPRRLTGGQQRDLMPRWSPDGRMLAFLSDRGGSLQIYVLPLDGGEPRQVSHLTQDVSEYCWRPDSGALLAHSAWKASDDQSGRSEDGDIAIVYTRLDETLDGMGHKQNRHQHLWLIPLEEGQEATRLTSEPVDVVQSCWSPDGSEIAFCANRRADPDFSASLALWVLNLGSGQMRRLSPEEGVASMPAWSPDGHTIAYYHAPDQTESSNISPWIVSADGQSAPRPATSNARGLTSLELIVDEMHFNLLNRPRWYPDSRSLLVTVQQRGQVHLYRLDTEHDRGMLLTRGNGCYVDPHMSADGQVIALLRTDWFTPGDIWSMDGNGGNLRKLTGVNDAFLRSHALVRPRRITWKSFDGLDIEGWLYLPPLRAGEKAPLVLEVHGGPPLAWGDSYVHEFQVLVGRGIAVLAANPRGSTGYGEEFCKKNLNDWGGDDFRDLMAGLDYVVSTEPIDGSRLGIGGLSYGGYMTNWAITQTPRFKAAVSRNGISSLVTEAALADQGIWFDETMGGDEQDAETLRRSCSALTFVDNITTPLLLLHADNDLRCPFIESLQLFVALRKRKETVELVRYPGTSHLMDWPETGVPKQRLDRLRRTTAWFEKYL